MKNTHIIGFFGEPKAAAYLAKAISFYSRLFLFPFAVQWSEPRRTYKIASFNVCQKIVWAIFVIGNTISFLFWVSTSVGEMEELAKNGDIMAGILILLCLILTWLSVNTVIITIWFRQEKIISFLQSLQELGLEVLHLPSATIWLCPVLFYFASSLTNISSTTGQITVSHGSKMVTKGIICLLKKLGIIEECQSVICRGVSFTLRSFFKLIIFHGGCFCSMPHTLLLTVSIGLRQIGKEVMRTVESRRLPVNEGLRLYEKLRAISNAANSVFGSIMLTHYLCNLTYAIQTPFLFSEAGQMVEDVNYLLWLIVSALIWWTGSEFHRLVHEAFRKWIFVNLNQDMCLDDRLKLSIMSNTVEKDSVGFYCRYFIVTHRFLTTTCGAVITYGIIVLQVQLKPVEMCRGKVM